MRGPFFIEILSRNEGVKQRHRAETLPIRIGRGYHNDVILDDPAVSASHAEVEQTTDGGQLVIRDLDSRNGIVYRHERKKELELNGNTVFRLGQTLVRIRPADFQVPSEKEETVSYYWEGWRPALTGLCMIIMLAAVSTWVSDVGKFEALRYMGMAAATVIAGAIWCGIWAFASRLYSGNARFGRHLFIFACGIAIMEIWGLLSGMTAYALSAETLSRYSSHGTIAIAAAMIYFQLLTVNPNLRQPFAVACIVMALSGSGAMLMANYYRHGYTADELFMSERFPPIIRQTHDRSVEDLINDAKRLKASVDRERSKAVAEGDDKDMYANDSAD